MTTRRKLAIATWSAPREGNIYGKLTVDVTNALAYLDWVREKTGEKVTITHLIGRAVGMGLAQAPGLNGVIRLGSYVQHSQVDVSFLVALEEGANLAKAKVERIDGKSVAAIAAELRELADKLRKGKDDQFKKSQGPLKFLPTWIIRPLVNLSGYLSGIWGVSLPMFGLEAYPFGGAIITNVGVFGLDEGFAPPTPFAHAPTYVLIGAVRQQPWVVDGRVEVRPLLTLCATIDHRFMDGAQGGVLAKVIRRVLENPWELEGMSGPPA